MNLPYQKYFEGIPGYLTVQDRNFYVLEANSRFKEDFGDFAGRYCYQVYKNRSEKCENCPVERTFEDGQSHSSEEQIKCLSGKEKSVIVYTTPVKNERGEITSVIEMSTDITGVKKLLNMARKNRQHYEILFDSVPCYITIQDSNLRIQKANKRFREEFGNNDYLGRHCYKVYKKRDEECIPCPVMETFDDNKVHGREEVLFSKSGEKKNVLVYTSPIYNSDDKVSQVMEVSLDITPIRKLQSQLESMGILISTISHGIKGMLNGLDGGIYMVNTGMEKNNQKRLEDGWEIVLRNVERIRNMVMNILYYAKERKPIYEVISVAEMIKEVHEFFLPKADANKIDFKLAIDENSGEFEIDPNSIRSLLINLLENSLYACKVDKHKTDHKIELLVKGNENSLQIKVSDNGIGMTEEERDKALTLFFSSKGSEGTGLGLFIANNIAKAHGGSIKLESEFGKGTAFILDMPRNPPKDIKN